MMTTAHADDLTPELEALMGLYLLHGRMVAHVEGLDMSTTVTKQERQVIIRLFAPRRMGDLAREVGALPSTMTAVADCLCAKGLLARTKDPEDRRAHLIALSEKGEAIRQRLTAEASNAFQTQAGLSPAEAQALTGLLRKVRTHIAETHFEGCGITCG